MNRVFKLKRESRRRLAGGKVVFNHRAALTLIEMMVAVTLLAVIVVGLLAMFQYTQRALHVAHMQTDVFESARAAVHLVSRDLSETADYGDTNVTLSPNFFVTLYPNPIPGSTLQPAEAPYAISVGFVEAFWLTRVNDDWQGIGYYVDGTNFGVGTLYKFSQSVRQADVGTLFNIYKNTTNFHRVSDGIVHFVLTPVYSFAYTNNGQVQVQYKEVPLRSVPSFAFPNADSPLPAYIDLEIGVLEPATLKQFQALVSLNTQPAIASAQTFLQDHVGKIHFFRERVPVRNFINPYRADEL